MRRAKYLFGFGLVALCAGLASSRAFEGGYIDRAGFDVTSALPDAPTEGTDRYELDREIFRHTRALDNTPRWAMAVNDVQLDATHMLADFSCAAGITLSPASAPRLVRLLTKASRDTDAESGIAKKHFKRLRPFKIDSGPICEPASDVANSYDYPSGHTTQGWTWALILAELLPERAQAILARGRAFGESRIVCGVHNASAVEAGRTSAAATLSVIRARPAYRDDFAAAQDEINGLRATGAKPDDAQCKAEAGLVAQDIFISTGHQPQ